MKRGIPHTRQQEQGFTLMEVITALAILSVMITLNYKILLGIMESKQMLDDKREGMFLANSLLTRISRELQLAVRRPLLPNCNGLTTTSDSQAGMQKNPVITTERVAGGMSLSFVAQEAGQYIPDGGTHSGLVQITYRPAGGSSQEEQLPDGQFYLIREEIPYTKPLSTACKNALRFPISNNLTSIQFKFLNKQSKQWTDVWENEDGRQLPAIIQFSAELKTPRGKTETYTSAIKLFDG
jgi:prepilin-type N-terminal cleavage/methylation domain-containing protein